MVEKIINNIRRLFEVVHGHSKKTERGPRLTGPQVRVIKLLSEAAPIKVEE